MAPAVSNGSSVEESSNLCEIAPPSNDPMDLFKEWFEDAKASNVLNPLRMCVSSSSSAGHVTARSLILRQLDDDGFIIMTDARSLKVSQWKENPRSAFTFFWGLVKGEREISKQVRAEGRIEELSSSEYSYIYDREPLFAKIRAHICNQGQEVEWRNLKASHDELLERVKAGTVVLTKPDHVVFYKLHPNVMEFYLADDVSIGDRVLFSRANESIWKGGWKNHHISA